MFNHNKNIITHHSLIDFAKVPEEKQEELILTLYEIYKKSRVDEDFTTFRNRFKPKTNQTIHVHIMKNDEQEWVGYGIIQRILLQYPPSSETTQSRFAMFRSSVTIREEYRGGRLAAVGTVELIDRFHKENPDVNIIAFNVAVHPLSYLSMRKNTAVFYPSTTEETPATVLQFMDYLRKESGYQLMGQSPYLIKYDNPSRISEAERIHLCKQKDPDIQLFVQQTQLKPTHALLCFGASYLVPENSLRLPPIKNLPTEKNPPHFSSELELIPRVGRVCKL